MPRRKRVPVASAVADPLAGTNFKLEDPTMIKSCNDVSKPCETNPEEEMEVDQCVLKLSDNIQVGEVLTVTINYGQGQPILENFNKAFLKEKESIAGTANPTVKRLQAIKPKKFSEEPLSLECEWEDCSFKTNLLDVFMDHVGSHVPMVEVVLKENYTLMDVILNCKWKECPWKTDKTSEDLQRHLFLHAYHTKLKCFGLNTLGRTGLNPCTADSSNRNILPDLSADLACAWAACCQKFTNIQLYYNHIKDHIDETPRGKNVPGGIRCVWRGCASTFLNAVKLRDHMRSHTQEKIVSCPTCGGLFANRTRFFDHCRRQELCEDESFTCEVCMKTFSTARLLREHVRFHINSYKCKLCEMSCNSPSALNSHMKYKHSTDKPYSCQFCDYKCKSYNDLVRHTKIHGGIVYTCTEKDCDYKCKAASTFKSHWDKVHGGGHSKYSCHICDKKFLKGYYLTKHLSRLHNLQWPSGHSRFRYKLHEDGYYKLPNYENNTSPISSK